MVTILSTLVSLLSFRVRSRASLELELVALRHQVTVMRRQHLGRLRLFSTDRLLWVWLYRIWPQCLNAMVLVKPATVVQWHRKGFRLYWRWRSRRPGRPKMSSEIRDLIRRMRSIEWVVYAKRPFAGPKQVLAYLARYTHRVAIANSRLLSLSDGMVRFRWKDYR